MKKIAILFIGLLAGASAFGQADNANFRALQENLDRVDMLIVNTQSKIAEAKAKLERKRNEFPENEYEQKSNKIERFDERLEALRNERQELLTRIERQERDVAADDDRVKERNEIRSEIRQANEELRTEMAEVDREVEQAYAEGNEEKIDELREKRNDKIRKHEERMNDLREKRMRDDDYDDRKDDADEMRKEREELDRELTEIDREIEEARAEGKSDKVADLQAKREEKINKHQEKVREKNKDRGPKNNRKKKERGNKKNKEDRGRGNPN